jgi:Cof subfamily protein (haloacid dehalogenase superfamily)
LVEQHCILDGGITLVYRLLALDIDGTLLESNNKLDRRTKDAIDFVKSKDVHVTLVTERHFHSAKKVAKALKLNEPIITQNGAFIATSVDKPLFEMRIRSGTVHSIVDVLEKYDCHVRVSHERYSVGNRVKQRSDLVAKMTIGIGDPLFYPVTFVDSLSEYLTEHDVSPTKMIVHFNDDEEKEEARNEIELMFNDINTVYTDDQDKNSFDIVAAGVSKAKGLKILGDHLGVSQEEVVAVGDSFSDMEMIKQAGLGVAMQNAPIELKKAADWVTRSNDQRGVSYTVREVFRKQLRMQI